MPPGRSKTLRGRLSGRPGGAPDGRGTSRGVPEVSRRASGEAPGHPEDGSERTCEPRRLPERLWIDFRVVCGGVEMCFVLVFTIRNACRTFFVRAAVRPPNRPQIDPTSTQDQPKTRQSGTSGGQVDQSGRPRATKSTTQGDQGRSGQANRPQMCARPRNPRDLCRESR